MTPLLTSLAVLLIGPFLYRLARTGSFLLALLDGFTLFAIGALVLVDILPHTVEQAGWWVLLLLLAGLFLPGLLERMRDKVASQVHAAAIYAGILALCAHSVTDGVALAAPSGGGSGGLSLAVILHRIPVGLTIWALIRPVHGVGIASLVLGLVGIFTIGGYFAGEPVLAQLDETSLAAFTAFVSGALLHVVVHSPGQASRNNVASAIGAVVAAVCAFVVMRDHSHVHVHHGHDHGHGHDHAHEAHGESLDGAASGGQFMDVLYELGIESAPALLLAYAAAGLIHAFLPKASVNWMRRGGRFGQSLKGVAFGLPLPICSCGVIPIYRSLALQGVPASAGMSFLVATPELGIDALFLSFQFLGSEFALTRFALVAVVSILVGWVMGLVMRPRVEPDASSAGEEQQPRPKLTESLKAAFRSGFGEMVDQTGPWIIFGLVLAAFCFPLLDHEDIASMGHWQILVFAVLGVPTYVCASGATPLMAVFIFGGVSPGAAVAFLLTGPATNVTTFGVLSQLHGRRVAVIFGATMIALAIASGYCVNWMLADVQIPQLLSAEHEHGVLGQVCLGVLGLLFTLSLFRQGPRGFIGQVLSQADEGHHHHHHDHAGHHGGHDPCHGPQKQDCC